LSLTTLIRWMTSSHARPGASGDYLGGRGPACGRRRVLRRAHAAPPRRAHGPAGWGRPPPAAPRGACLGQPGAVEVRETLFRFRGPRSEGQGTRRPTPHPDSGRRTASRGAGAPLAHRRGAGAPLPPLAATQWSTRTLQWTARSPGLPCRLGQWTLLVHCDSPWLHCENAPLHWAFAPL